MDLVINILYFNIYSISNVLGLYLPCLRSWCEIVIQINIGSSAL